MEKITIEMWDSNDDPNIKKSFQGEWLVQGLEAEEDDSGVQWCRGVQFSVAKTAKGALAVYVTGGCPDFQVYATFDEFKDATDGGVGGSTSPRYPRNVVAEVASALDIEFEVVLDI